MNEELKGAEAAEIARLARAAAAPKLVEIVGDEDGIYLVPDPAGGDPYEFDPNKYRDYPRRKRGTARFLNAGSLAAYVTGHLDTGHTEVYADINRSSVTAVLNSHGETEAGWGDHRAVLQLELTPEWKTWVASSGEMRSQEDFAELIEDRIVDLVEPDGATMLEIAQSIRGTTGARFESTKRLASGQVGLSYVEEIDAKAGPKGDLKVPASFKIALTPYRGGDKKYALTARFRYRINGGRLTVGYILDRPQDVLDLVFGDIVDQISEATGVEVFLGTPPEPLA